MNKTGKPNCLTRAKEIEGCPACKDCRYRDDYRRCKWAKPENKDKVYVCPEFKKWFFEEWRKIRIAAGKEKDDESYYK